MVYYRRLLSAKVTLSPSGRVAFSWARRSHPSPAPCQSCQSSAELETGAIDKTGVSLSKGVDIQEPGKGGLGNKDAMSWKSGVALRERMAASELEYGRRNSWFLTLTIPGGDSKSFEGLARYSSYAIDRLNRELNRYFDGQEFARCSVWEYQERGALHSHILISSHCIHAMNIERFRLRIIKVWYSILLSIQKKFPCNPFMDAQGNTRHIEDILRINNGENFVNCQVIKKSVVAYLSSYLSDSNHKKDYKKKQELRRKYFPIATWCQWNRQATKVFNKYSETHDFGDCPDVDMGSVKDAFKSLEKAIPMAEGTEIKYPKNPFVNGFYAIIDRTVKNQKEHLLEIAKNTLDCIFDDRYRYKEWLLRKARNPHKKTEREQIEEIENSFWNRTIFARRMYWEKHYDDAVQLGNELSFLGVFMLKLMEEKEEILSSNPYPNCTQLEIDFA